MTSPTKRTGSLRHVRSKTAMLIAIGRGGSRVRTDVSYQTDGFRYQTDGFRRRHLLDTVIRIDAAGTESGIQSHVSYQTDSQSRSPTST
jgi:hypothetical protein